MTEGLPNGRTSGRGVVIAFALSAALIVLFAFAP